jgi:hypothetical protein
LCCQVEVSGVFKCTFLFQTVLTAKCNRQWLHHVSRLTHFIKPK